MFSRTPAATSEPATGGRASGSRVRRQGGVGQGAPIEASPMWVDPPSVDSLDSSAAKIEAATSDQVSGVGAATTSTRRRPLSVATGRGVSRSPRQTFLAFAMMPREPVAIVSWLLADDAATPASANSTAMTINDDEQRHVWRNRRIVLPSNCKTTQRRDYSSIAVG